MASSKGNRVPFEYSEIPLNYKNNVEKLSVDVAFEDSDCCNEATLLLTAVTAAAPDPPCAEKKEAGSRKRAILPATFPKQIPETLQKELAALIEKREVSGTGGKVVVTRCPSGVSCEELGVVEFGAVGHTLDDSSILHGYSDPSKLGGECKLTGCKAGGSKKTISCANAFTVGKAIGSFMAGAGGKHLPSVVLHVPGSLLDRCAVKSLLQGVYAGFLKDERFKTKAEESAPRRFTVFLPDSGEKSAFDGVTKIAKEFALGTQLARELVNTPPNICNPETLAKVAVGIAKEFGFEHRVMGREECEQRKMGAYLAVHQGSMWEPQFIHLTYKPKSGAAKKKIAFVGKGICMDTGGYNLKINYGIENMKDDMGGAAAVLGAARIIGALQPPNVEVHFISAAAENMISSHAYRPGDILTASNGTTIEIGNTDAEGRLTLADALIYAEKEIAPDAILDIATLTGASMVGLGCEVGSLFSTCDQWMKECLEAARTSGSPAWPMPLVQAYKRFNDSKIADISNCASTRYGGSITAALFLREFIQHTPWCHVDVAGPVFSPDGEGATGYGPRLLAELICGISEKC